MTTGEAYALVARLRAAYPNVEFPEETVELYVQRLESLEATAGALTVEDLIDHCQWMPSIAELLAGYSDALQEIRRSRIELEEPPATPAELAESARQIRALQKMTRDIGADRIL